MSWTVDGLPLHPLLVHAAVIMLAANGVALLTCVAMPRFRNWLGWGLPLLGVSTAATSWLTKVAGERLLGGGAASGPLADHTHWGGWAGVVALVLGGTTLVYWLSTMPRLERQWPWLRAAPVRIVVGALAAGVAITAIVIDVLAGHSGATSVWG